MTSASTRPVRIPPGGFTLASTLEEFDMPDDVLGIVHDKSTWARMGLAAQNTVIEPGWNGYLTLELTNHGDEEIFIDDGTPIVQIIFHMLDQPAEPPIPASTRTRHAGRRRRSSRTAINCRRTVTMSASEKTERLLRLSLPVTALVKNEANPNKMAAREFDLLIDNIERTGLTDPILVRPLDYEAVFEIAAKFDMPDLELVLTKEELKFRIVGGHHRFDAAAYLGLEDVPGHRDHG